MSDEYKSATYDKEVHVCEKRTEKSIFRYEFSQTKDKHGWWITREHYSVESSFPEKIDIYLPQEVVDIITAYNAKDKLNS